MSLDIWLKVPNSGGEKPLSNINSGIFVRQNGQTLEISRDIWDQLNPDREPVVVTVNNDDEDDKFTTVWEYNITHNLGKMARAAGVYHAMWRPEESNATLAMHIIAPLKDGLAELQTNPDRFKEFNPKNGWGDYDGLVKAVASYLSACNQYPKAHIETWR